MWREEDGGERRREILERHQLYFNYQTVSFSQDGGMLSSNKHTNASTSEAKSSSRRLKMRGADQGDIVAIGGKLYELKTPTQRRYVQYCAKKLFKPNEYLFRSFGNMQIVTHIDALDPEEIDETLKFIHQTSSMNRISIISGKQLLRREMKSKLVRLGMEEPLAYTQAGSIQIIRTIAPVIYKSPKLIRLDLYGLKLYPQSHKLLTKALSKLESLTWLSFAGTCLGDDGLAALSNTIGQMAHLNYLCLSRCALTEKARHDISKIVRVHAVRRDEKYWSSSLRGQVPHVEGDGLELLDLSDNKLGDACVEELSEVLSNDKWLVGLNLRSNSIGPRGVVTLAELLKTNSTLLVLQLKHNSNLDDRLVGFIDNLLKKREEKISAAVSTTSTANCAERCRILSKWSIPAKLLPSLPYHRSSDEEDFSCCDIMSAEEDNNAEEEQEQCSEAKPVAQVVKKKRDTKSNQSDEPERHVDVPKDIRKMKKAPLKGVKKKVIKRGTRKTAKTAGAKKAEPPVKPEVSALDLLSKPEPHETSASPGTIQEAWAFEFMERIKKLELAQKDSQKHIAQLEAENQQLQSKLNAQAKKSKARSKAPKISMKKEASKPISAPPAAIDEIEIMMQLESSISQLAKQVQKLEDDHQSPTSPAAISQSEGNIPDISSFMDDTKYSSFSSTPSRLGDEVARHLQEHWSLSDDDDTRFLYP